MNHYFCKTVIFLSVLVIAACLIFRFTVIAGQNMEIDQLQTSYLKARIKITSDKDNINSSINKAEQDLKKITDSLPAFNEFPYVLKNISALIQKKNLKSSGLLFKPARTERLAMWQYSSSFSVQGNYANLKSFIAAFQNFSGINTISKLFFRLKPEVPGDITLDMNVAIYCRGDSI